MRGGLGEGGTRRRLAAAAAAIVFLCGGAAAAQTLAGAASAAPVRVTASSMWLTLRLQLLGLLDVTVRPAPSPTPSPSPAPSPSPTPSPSPSPTPSPSPSPPGALADLALSVDHEPGTTSGEFTQTWTVRNLGPDPTAAVLEIDAPADGGPAQLPETCQAVSDSPTVDVRCTTPSLDRDASRRFIITWRPSGSGTLTWRGTVSPVQATDGESANNHAEDAVEVGSSPTHG